MNFFKLDPGLLSAYADASETDALADPLEIFVHTNAPPTQEQAELLSRLGVRNILPGRRLFTGTVTVEGVDALSEQSWVKFLTIARTLLPADKGKREAF
jgi:hypothetical protein